MSHENFGPDRGLADAKAIYLVSVVEILVTDLAKRHRIKTRDKPVRRLTTELSFKGVIDEDLHGDIDRSIALREDLAHDPNAALWNGREELDRLVAICESLFELIALADSFVEGSNAA